MCKNSLIDINVSFDYFNLYQKTYLSQFLTFRVIVGSDIIFFSTKNLFTGNDFKKSFKKMKMKIWKSCLGTNLFCIASWFRGVYRTQSNIQDRGFLQKFAFLRLLVTIFAKTLHRRSFNAVLFLF